MYKWITYFVLIVFFISCSSLHHIEKRRYQSGYFFQLGKKIKPNDHANLQKENVSLSEEMIVDNNNKQNENEKQTDSLDNHNIDNQSINEKSLVISELLDYSLKQNSNNGQTSLISKNTTQQITTKNDPILSNYILFFIAAFLGGASLVSLILSKGNSKKLAHWGSKNSKTTIALITLLKVVLTFQAIHIGVLLGTLGFQFSFGAIYSLLILLSISALLYPVRNKLKGLFKQGFIRQKLHDILLVVLGFSIFIGVGNVSTHSPELVPITSSIVENTQDFPIHFNHNDKEIDNSKGEGEVAAKIFLTILTIAAFLGLLYLTAILSCSLSCSGQDGLAALVIMTGLIGGTALFVLTLKAIWKKRQPAISDSIDQ